MNHLIPSIRFIAAALLPAQACEARRIVEPPAPRVNCAARMSDSAKRKLRLDCVTLSAASGCRFPQTRKILTSVLGK
jgi:hypothetical protein